MEFRDDDLRHFEEHGAVPLPEPEVRGQVEHDGALIHYEAHGAGSPVILLHGGLGHGGNWGHQVPALLADGHRVILIDSRGHGRSTRDARPYSYELMAADVLAVMDALDLAKAAFVGWSDGACAVSIMMKTQPNCTPRELGAIAVPVAIVLGEHGEFIKRDHAEYLARTIPGAEFIILSDVSHFAPLQRPEAFNAAMLTFLARIDAARK